jgi:hypothetical protein
MSQLGVQNPPPILNFPTDLVLVYDSVAQQFVTVPLGSIIQYTLINTLTASASTSLVDTTSIRTAYNDYMIVFDNLIPATNAVHLEMQVQSGGTFQTTGYLNSAGAVTTYIDITQTATLGNIAGGGLSGRLTIHNVNGTTTVKQVTGTVTYETNTSTAAAATTAGWWNGGNGAVTGLQFLMSSGNITSGTIKIYGLL